MRKTCGKFLPRSVMLQRPKSVDGEESVSQLVYLEKSNQNLVNVFIINILLDVIWNGSLSPEAYWTCDVHMKPIKESWLPEWVANCRSA
jgi:hypothetical protein